MKDFWNNRYNETEYAYGKNPNVFFANCLKNISKGVAILPCEGEGRNAVYAAKNGFTVYASDFSEAAKNKALALAKEIGVQINYDVSDVLDLDYPNNSADIVALIYAHFPEKIRKKLHEKTINWLKPGGKIILEAFNQKQLGNTSGGPKDISMLYSKSILEEDFRALKLEMLEENTVDLKEGKYHQGKAEVIRLIAVKTK